jgi:hypothetical protein
MQNFSEKRQHKLNAILVDNNWSLQKIKLQTKEKNNRPAETLQSG